MARFHVVLHGKLRDLYPHDIELEAENVAEMINGLCRQTKAFNPTIGQEKHVVNVVGFDTVESLYAPVDEPQIEVHLTPAFCGGKKGGFVKIALGVLMIAASFIPGAFPLTIAGFSISASSVFFMGVSMLLGGLLELMSPAPKLDLTGDVASDPEASKYLGTPKNTVKSGTRIPLLYGEHMAYGHFISFNVDAKDVAI